MATNCSLSSMQVPRYFERKKSESLNSNVSEDHYLFSRPVFIMNELIKLTFNLRLEDLIANYRNKFFIHMVNLRVDSIPLCIKNRKHQTLNLCFQL